MWLPLHGMGSSLLPVLPHEPPAILAPLSSRTIFRHFTALCSIRLFDIHASPTVASPNRGGSRYSRDLELLYIQPIVVWESMDEGSMLRCSVVEDLGLQLVRLPKQSPMPSSLTGCVTQSRFPR